MTFRVLDALPILVLRYGETVNKVSNNTTGRLGLENKNKVMGFHTSCGKALGIDIYPKNFERVRLWLEQPAPPTISGIIKLPYKKCADLNRWELRPLADIHAIYLEVETKAALLELLKWYS